VVFIISITTAIMRAPSSFFSALHLYRAVLISRDRERNVSLAVRPSVCQTRELCQNE